MGERRADLIRERQSYVKNEFVSHHYHDGGRRRKMADRGDAWLKDGSEKVMRGRRNR